MKKLLAFSAALAIAFAASAALDFSAAKAVFVKESAGSFSGTNHTVFAASGLKGNAEVFVLSRAVYGRTSLDLSLWTTNTVDGGWSLLAEKSYTSTNAGVFRLSFPAEYLTSPARLSIGSMGAASTVGAFILSY